MRKPNVIFLSIIALAALLPQTSRWLGSDETSQHPSATAVREEPIREAVRRTTPPPALALVENPSQTIAVAARKQPQKVEEADLTIQDERGQWDVLPIEEPVVTEDPLAGLEEAYMVEDFDPDWAAPLEANFHSVFDAVRLQDSVVEQAECRSTLCRFAITHKNSLAQDTFVQAFLQSRLLSLNHVSIAQHSQRAADGSIAAVYFLSRNELAQVQN